MVVTNCIIVQAYHSLIDITVSLWTNGVPFLKESNPENLCTETMERIVHKNRKKKGYSYTRLYFYILDFLEPQCNTDGLAKYFLNTTNYGEFVFVLYNTR